MTVTVRTYTPFPKQAAFHRSPAKFRLFGGAAGPGKTAALLWEGLSQNWETPGSTTLLLRRTLRELDDSLLKEFHKSVPWREMGARYDAEKNRVFWSNKSETRFGYCASENDVYQYQGGEYLFIGFDELTHFTLKQWQFLNSRNRHPSKFATMAGATNPGNVGHAWVKALWIDKRPAPGMDEPEKYNPGEYDFIRALIGDNPIYANDQNYIRSLDGLGKALRTAMLEGLWDQFAGQYFDIFNPLRHIATWQGSKLCNGETRYEIAPWWPRWISLDWGFKHDSAIHWHTTAPDGRHITYREWCVSGLTPRMLGEGIVERSIDGQGRAENIQQWFLSPDAFADRTGESTIAELLRSTACRGDRFPLPTPASDDRVGGWQLLYQLLQQDQWLISEDCTKLIETLPILVRDEKHPEDIKKVDGDDAPDGARYGLYSRLGAVRAPIEVRAAEKVAKITDPTMRVLTLDKFYAEEAVRDQPVPVMRRHSARKFGF